MQIFHNRRQNLSTNHNILWQRAPRIQHIFSKSELSDNLQVWSFFFCFFLFFYLLPLFKPKNKQKSDFFACLSQIFQFAAVLNKISFCILFQQVIHIIHNSPYYPHLDGAALACAQRRQAKIPLKPKAAKKAGEKRLLYAL